MQIGEIPGPIHENFNVIRLEIYLLIGKLSPRHLIKCKKISFRHSFETALNFLKLKIVGTSYLRMSSILCGKSTKEKENH